MWRAEVARGGAGQGGAGSPHYGRMSALRTILATTHQQLPAASDVCVAALL